MHSHDTLVILLVISLLDIYIQNLHRPWPTEKLLKQTEFKNKWIFGKITQASQLFTHQDHRIIPISALWAIMLPLDFRTSICLAILGPDHLILNQPLLFYCVCLTMKIPMFAPFCCSCSCFLPLDALSLGPSSSSWPSSCNVAESVDGNCWWN